MAVQPAIDARTLGLRYAEEIAGERGVEELWVYQHPDTVEMWLITDDLDFDAQSRFDEALIGLYDAFPSARVRFHLWSPQRFDEGYDFRSLVRRGAEQIPLRD